MSVIQAPDLASLMAAIKQANNNPNVPHTITLTGNAIAYVIREARFDLFGALAFPPIIGYITIQGEGRSLSRSESAAPFRFFAVQEPYGTLMLHDLRMSYGNSGGMGGGAIVNNRLLYAKNCAFRGNRGSLGGVIYNGDAKTVILEGCTFEENVASEEGGGVFNATGANCIVTGCTFKNNRVEAGKSADLYVSGPYVRPIILHNTHLESGFALKDDVLPLGEDDTFLADT